jgi:cytochrome P450
MSEGSGMTEQASSKTVAQFPVARSFPFDPPAEYLAQAVYRARLPSGQDAWIVTRHQDVRAALSDPRLSADLTKPGYPVLRAQAAESPLKGTFMRADGEAHQRVRRMLNDEFTLRRRASGGRSTGCWTGWSRRGPRPTSSRRWRCRCRRS